MNKILLPVLFFCLFLAACSSGNTTEEREKQKSIEKQKEVSNLEPTTLFTYEFGEDDSYEFRGIDSAADASTILFSTQEKIKRKKETTKYILYGGNEPIDVKELSEASEDKLEGKLCTRNYMSPNGQYVTFSCALDDRWFMVYDTIEDKIIHHEPDQEEPAIDMIGITNDMEILQYDRNNDKIIIENTETEETKQFDLAKLIGRKDESIENIIPVNDGKRFFIYNYERFYILDTETETLEEIVDVKPYQDKFQEDTEDILIGNIRVSPNGKYAFFRLGDSASRDDVYESYTFVNLETGEKESYIHFDYREYGTIDNDGNMILADSDHTYFYHIDSGEMKTIPNVKPGVYTEYLTITADGNHLLYADRIRDSDEKPAYELFQLDMKDKDSFETAEFRAEKEDTEKILGTTNEKESGNKGIALYPVKEDPRELFQNTWEKSAAVPYPSKFPEKVSSIGSYFSDDSFSQNIYLDSGGTFRKEISYNANDYTDSDRKNYCIDDDLELEKTEDGVDYYFYLFHNKEVELSYVKDNWCYSFEGKGFTKDEMFTIVDSMKIQGKKPDNLPLDEVKFPSRLPIQDAEITHIHAAEHKENNGLLVEYRGERDEIKIKYDISKKEPTYYHNDDTKSVELGNGMVGSYYEKYPRLFMYDGAYYYTIETDAKNELIKELGGKESLKEALINIGNAVE